MKDPFEAYRKSKSYSFLGSRIGKFCILYYLLVNTEIRYINTGGASKKPWRMFSAILCQFYKPDNQRCWERQTLSPESVDLRDGEMARTELQT